MLFTIGLLAQLNHIFLRSSVPCFYGVVTTKGRAASCASTTTSRGHASTTTSRRPSTRTRPSISPMPTSSWARHQHPPATSHTSPSSSGHSSSASSNSNPSNDNHHTQVGTRLPPSLPPTTENHEVDPSLPPPLPPMTETNPEGVADGVLSPEDHDEPDDNESINDSLQASDNDYVPGANASKSSDESEVTPHPLEEDSGIDDEDSSQNHDGFVGGGFMGEGDYSVAEFSSSNLLCISWARALTNRTASTLKSVYCLRLVHRCLMRDQQRQSCAMT